MPPLVDDVLTVPLLSGVRPAMQWSRVLAVCPLSSTTCGRSRCEERSLCNLRLIVKRVLTESPSKGDRHRAGPRAVLYSLHIVYINTSSPVRLSYRRDRARRRYRTEP